MDMMEEDLPTQSTQSGRTVPSVNSTLPTTDSELVEALLSTIQKLENENQELKEALENERKKTGKLNEALENEGKEKEKLNEELENERKEKQMLEKKSEYNDTIYKQNRKLTEVTVDVKHNSAQDIQTEQEPNVVHLKDLSTKTPEQVQKEEPKEEKITSSPQTVMTPQPTTSKTSKNLNPNAKEFVPNAKLSQPVAKFNCTNELGKSQEVSHFEQQNNDVDQLTVSAKGNPQDSTCIPNQHVASLKTLLLLIHVFSLFTPSMSQCMFQWILPVSLNKLASLQTHVIIFWDMDNWINFFTKLPNILPENILVIGFYGGKTTWKEPDKCEAYRYQADSKRIFFHDPCGTTKDAADAAILVNVGRMDACLPSDVNFILLSGDQIFSTIPSLLNRKLVVINPHEAEKISSDCIHTMITSVAET